MIFSSLQGKIYALKKLGASQRYCAPERALLESSAQFVKAWSTLISCEIFSFSSNYTNADLKI